MSRRAPVLAIFILSGAAGLIYEVVWSRQLVLVFGNTTQAVSAILTGFFGGMAIGSALGGRLADRVRRPLRLYGLIELGLVVVVLATPLAFRLLDDVYRGAYPALETNPQALTLVRLALSLLALGPATVLMGATLPTLTRFVAHDAEREFSGAFGRLYSANTIGGIAGTLVAGFVLIEALGLSGALFAGATCSATAGIAALLLESRWRRDSTISPPMGGAESARSNVVQQASSPPARRAVLALSLAFVSGLTSLAIQVLWTRLVAAGTGNSTYVFTLILAVFLTGLAIGAVVFTILDGKGANPMRLIAFGQVGTAILLVLGMALIEQQLIDRVGPTTPLRHVLRVFVLPTVAVVLPATILIGLTFPATSALLRGATGRLAGDAGALLAANTFGAICGTFVVPFFVIPAIGSPMALGVVAALDAAVGLGLAASIRRPLRWSIPVTSIGLVTAVSIIVGASGGAFFTDPTAGRVRDSGGTVYATAEDDIAPVVAGEAGGGKQLWVTGSSMTILTVDTNLMPILPLMLRPAASRALVIAFGMGSAYRSALIAGLRTDAVELVPSVPKMFGYFWPDASKYASDPSGRIIIADGRNYVALADRRYDIVVVDPPPPIETSGVSVISSLEFYRAVHDRLVPSGVMMQWIPYGQTVDEFRAHLRTFRSVYRHVIAAFSPANYGIYMLGSDDPIGFDPAAVRGILARPGVVADLDSAPDSPQLDATGWLARIPSLVWIEDEAVDRFVGDGPLVTDDRPLPEYFLLRHIFGPPSRQVSKAILLSLVPSTAGSR